MRASIRFLLLGGCAALLSGGWICPSALAQSQPPRTAAAASARAGKPVHLTKAHTGWRKTDCFTCHEGQRVTSKGQTRRETDCGACHGYNGAPHEAHAIKTNPCGNCHATVEHVAHFEAPGDCITCHFHPESPTGK